MKKVKMAKKVLGLLLVTAMLFTLGACNRSSNSSGSQSSTKKVKFAYLSPSLDNPFWKTVADGVTAGAKQAGVTLKIYDSNNDANTQMKNAQDVITQQYDGILMTPTDSNTAPSVLNAAKAAKIPVVLVNVGSFSGEYVSLIDTGEKQGGLSVGKYLAEQLKAQNKGTDAVINEISISLSRTNGQLRHGGFEEGLKEGNYSIKFVKQSSLYTRDESYKFTQDMITAYPNMVALFCNFDEAVLGASKAIQDMGKGNQIMLIGYDGSKESVQALKDGKISAICLQEPYKQGKVAPQTLLDYLNGKKPDKEIQIPTVLVTKDNVGQYEDMLKNDVFGE